jgi:hypothetical protein
MAVSKGYTPTKSEQLAIDHYEIAVAEGVKDNICRKREVQNPIEKQTEQCMFPKHSKDTPHSWELHR